MEILEGLLIVSGLIGMIYTAFKMTSRSLPIEPYILLEFECRLPKEIRGLELRDFLRRSKVVAVNREFEVMMDWQPNTKRGNALMAFPQAEEFIVNGVPDEMIVIGNEDDQVKTIAGHRVHWRYHKKRRHVIFYVQPHKSLLPFRELMQL